MKHSPSHILALAFIFMVTDCTKKAGSTSTTSDSNTTTDPNAGAPTTSWIVQSGSANNIVTTLDMSVDNSGNSYVVGYTTAGMNGQSQTGTFDAFLVKYTSSGTLAWTKQWGVTGQYTIPFAVSVDPASGYAAVGGYTTGALTGSQHGSTDLFLIAVDTNGNVENTEQAGTNLKSTSVKCICGRTHCRNSSRPDTERQSRLLHIEI